MDIKLLMLHFYFAFDNFYVLFGACVNKYLPQKCMFIVSEATKRPLGHTTDVSECNMMP